MASGKRRPTERLAKSEKGHTVPLIPLDVVVKCLPKNQTDPAMKKAVEDFFMENGFYPIMWLKNIDVPFMFSDSSKGDIINGYKALSAMKDFMGSAERGLGGFTSGKGFFGLPVERTRRVAVVASIALALVAVHGKKVDIKAEVGDLELYYNTLSQYPRAYESIRFKLDLKDVGKAGKLVSDHVVVNHTEGAHFLWSNVVTEPSIGVAKSDVVTVSATLRVEAEKYLKNLPKEYTVITAVYSEAFYEKNVYFLHPFSSTFEAVISTIKDLSYYCPVYNEGVMTSYKEVNEGDQTRIDLPVARFRQCHSLSEQIKVMIGNGRARLKSFANPTASSGMWMNVLRGPIKGTMMLMDEAHNWSIIMVDPKPDPESGDQERRLYIKEDDEGPPEQRLMRQRKGVEREEDDPNDEVREDRLNDDPEGEGNLQDVMQ